MSDSLNRVEFQADEYPAKVIWLEKPPMIPPFHRKSLWQIVLVAKGQAVHHIGRSACNIRVGDVFVINNNDKHHYSGIHDLQLANVVFDYEELQVNQWQTRELRGFRELFHERPLRSRSAVIRARLHLEGRAYGNSLALIQEMDKTERERPPCWQMLMDCHFRHFVHLLSCAYDGHLRIHDEAPERMIKATSYLERHFREEIDLDRLGEELNMSKRTFYRLFKRATGQSPLAYLIRLRIQNACDGLRNSDRPITQVAFDSGFTDSNYFTREFRKIIGETPTSYRSRWAN